jgi:hypothetical protein
MLLGVPSRASGCHPLPRHSSTLSLPHALCHSPSRRSSTLSPTRSLSLTIQPCFGCHPLLRRSSTLSLPHALCHSPSRRTRQAVAKASSRTAAVFGTAGGALGCVSPLEEQAFRRLAALSKKLCGALYHTAGLHPAAFRKVRFQRPSPKAQRQCRILAAFRAPPGVPRPLEKGLRDPYCRFP